MLSRRQCCVYHEIFLVLFIWHLRCKESQKISVNKDQGTETVLSQIDEKIVIFCFSDELMLKNIRSDGKWVRIMEVPSLLAREP